MNIFPLKCVVFITRVRDTNEYEVSVNVAANSKVSFNLWYQEVLQRRLGVYEHIINIDPDRIVRDLQVEVNITEHMKIRHLFVPEIRREGNNNQKGSHKISFIYHKILR